MSQRDRYILAKRINRGGMAEIYLGKAVGEGGFARLCAIKRILPHYASDAEFVQMFRDEANICKRLNHANIVQVYSFEELDNSYALIMEFVEGADLRSILSACEKAHSRLAIPMAIYVGAEIARGLHYAHTKTDDVTRKALDIVHRDVSPQNILASFEGEVKITDFGIADAENKITETKPGIVKGKYSYMSPEQVNAEPLDARTDVFSLAIVLWEALAMRRLFSGESEVHTIKLVQNCEIPHRLVDLNPDVDDELEQIILKGLAKDRVHRYASAGAFEKALSKYLHSRFPDFTASELGDFMKKLFADKRDAIATEIRRTLTGTSSSTESKNRGRSKASASQKTRTREKTKKKNPSQKVRLPSPSESSQPIGLARRPLPRSGKSQFTQTDRGSMTRSRLGSAKFATTTPPVYQTSSRPNPLMLFLTVAVVLVGVGFMAIQLKSINAKPLTLQLRTTPANVRLNLDGKELFNGRYVQTPQKLQMPPGKHRMKISRSGYFPEVLEFGGAAGKTFREDKLIMRRDDSFRTSPVRFLVNPAGRKMAISIDNGFFIGVAPTIVADLGFGKEHTVVAYPRGVSDNREAFRCRFTPRSTSIRDPFIVTIYPSSRSGPKCTVRGP